MKTIFNDATELTVQQVIVHGDYITFKTVSATPEELRIIFKDETKTKKMYTEERGVRSEPYEGYTHFECTHEFTGKIYGVTMYRPERTPEAQSELMNSAVVVAKIQAQTLTDEQALTVKNLYDKWYDLAKEKFTAEKAEYKFTHEDILYKTINPNQEFQEQWVPGQGTESIFERIDESHAGTQEDPIPWYPNMRPEKDKYYVEGDLLAKCIEDSGQALYNKLSELCPGRYFQKVE